MRTAGKTLLLSTSALVVAFFMAAPVAQAAEIQMLPPKSINSSGVVGAPCAGINNVLIYSGNTDGGINCVTDLAAGLDGSLTAAGLASAGTLAVTGATTLTGAATLGSHLTVGGVTTLNGAFEATGTTSLNATTVRGELNITSKDDFVLGGQRVGDTLYSLQQAQPCVDGTALKKMGDGTFSCVMITNLKYGNNVVQADVPVCAEDQTITFNGTNFSCKSVLAAGGNITVPGNGTIGGNLTVEGDINGGDNITGDSFTSTDSSATNRFAGNVTVERGLGVGGDLDVAGVARVQRGITTDALAANSLSVTNNATIGGNATITGDLSANKVTAGAGGLASSGGLTITAGNIAASGSDLVVRDITARNGTFSGNLDVASLTVNGQPFTGGGGSSGPSICPALTTTVSSDTMWAPTGINVHAGSVLMIKANGTWSDNARTSTADGYGVQANNGNPLTYGAMGLLVGKIGVNGQPFAVGSRFSEVLTEEGELYMTINDDASWFGDNSGSLNVSVGGLGDSTTCPSTPEEPDMCAKNWVTVSGSSVCGLDCGNDNLRGTGISVRSGQWVIISTKINGQGWAFRDHPFTGPEGQVSRGNCNNCDVNTAPVDAVIGRIGPNGPRFAVGAYVRFRAERTGEIYLGRNHYGNWWDSRINAEPTAYIAIGGNTANGNCTAMPTPVNGVCSTGARSCVTGTLGTFEDGTFSCYGLYGTAQTACGEVQPSCNDWPSFTCLRGSVQNMSSPACPGSPQPDGNGNYTWPNVTDTWDCVSGGNRVSCSASPRSCDTTYQGG